MADFTALKTAIQNAIKQNGNEEITGDILQGILLSIVTTLGDRAINDLITALTTEVNARQQADGTLQQNITNEATARGNADTALQGLIDGITDNIENGYVYAGIATPSSTPATGKVFYLALTAGTYTNFGSTVVSQGINILKYNGSAWSLDAFIGIDDELTSGSNNLPKSGNVLENIIKNGSAFDLSAYNAVDGVPATYADLDAALAALSLLPAVYKQPGMSFRFVLTSDNKYVQYRLMSDSFNTTPANWQGVDDKPTADSNNLIRSKEIYKIVQATIGDVSLDKIAVVNNSLNLQGEGGIGRWQYASITAYHSGTKHISYIFDVSSYRGRTLICYSTERSNVALYAFVKDYTQITTEYDAESWASNVVEVQKGKSGYGSIISIVVPEGANQLILCGTTNEESVAFLSRPNKTIEEINSSINIINNAITTINTSIEKNDDDIKNLYNICAELKSITNDDGTVLSPISTVDNKAIGGASSLSSYGYWSEFEFKNYSEYRPDAIKGTKYVSRIYDTRQLVGKTLDLYTVPRSNLFSYVFVTDYTLIPVESDVEAWDAIYVDGKYFSSAVNNPWESSVVVPENGNYMIIVGTDYIDAVAINKHLLEQEITKQLLGIIGLIEPVEIVYNKAIGYNRNLASYGHWGSFSYADYSQREDKILGSKYVSRIYDTRSLIGKALNLHLVPRNNYWMYVFVTDYSLIPTESDVETWDSIVVDGYGVTTGGTTKERDYSVVVPENGNYLIVVGSDLEESIVMSNFQYGLLNRIEKLENNVKATGIGTESIIDLNNKKETVLKINNAIRIPRAGNAQQSITPLMLLHFSDIHGNSANISRIKEFYSEFNSYIDDVICTGDEVAQNITDGMDFWDNNDAENFLTCVGNHETYGAEDQSVLADPSVVYNTIIAPYVSNWGVTQPENAVAGAKCYYYKDYANSHIRLIVLDNYSKGDNNYIEEENIWLQSVLNNAIINSLSVIIAIHNCAGNINGFDCSFNTKQKGYAESNVNLAFLQSVDSFMNNGGEFVCYIGGHTHIDVCGVDATYQKQVKITIDAASRSSSSAYSDMFRSNNKEDKSYDCFNLIAIDTYQKIIKIIRIGADVDSWMRHKDMVTIQYASSTANPIENPTVISPYD